jgi:hypothetical protein
MTVTVLVPTVRPARGAAGLGPAVQQLDDRPGLQDRLGRG